MSITISVAVYFAWEGAERRIPSRMYEEHRVFQEFCVCRASDLPLLGSDSPSIRMPRGPGGSYPGYYATQHGVHGATQSCAVGRSP